MLTFLFDEQQERETYTAARDKEKIEEGKDEGKEEVIEKMDKKGYKPEEIADIVGWTIERVKVFLSQKHTA